MQQDGAMTAIARHRTAMARTALSKPLQYAYNDGLLDTATSVFDYGCGRGDDIRTLNNLGIRSAGWDPAHAPLAERVSADLVNIGYVVNVIEDQRERVEALRSAWELTNSVLVVSARLHWDADAQAGKPYRDGRLTGAGTFQKFYSPEELKTWIEGSLDQRAIAASPGTYYVFRDHLGPQRLLARHARRTSRPREGIAQLLYAQSQALLVPLETFVAEHRRLPKPGELPEAAALSESFGSVRSAFSLVRRVSGPALWTDVDLGSRQRSEQRFEEHLDDLQPLIDFVTDRGRLPRAGELSNEGTLVDLFGSVRAAFSLVRRVTGPSGWTDLESAARDNFLVYAALSAFGGRPKFGDLPEDLQYDAKDLFGSYTAACEAADRLLHRIADLSAIGDACKAATFGKLTPEALYVHADYMSELPALLRVYEGAARRLTGDVEDATIVKLNRIKPQVSFLAYPDFDTDPHPALTSSLVAKLGEIRVRFQQFDANGNPPILHRKELFVPASYPRRSKFERLTRQEDAAGLLDRTDIGTRREWAKVLAEAGLVQQGHRLVRR